MRPLRATATSLQAQEACSSYTTQPGDSLASIAHAAYGSYDYQRIFNANRSVISGNPNELAAGTVLQLPCEDGNISGAETAEEVIQREERKSADAVAKGDFQPPIKILVGNDWAPFMDSSLKGGGMLVRLTSTALHRGGNDREEIVAFVDDCGSHLRTLLPIGGFDVAVG